MKKQKFAVGLIPPQTKGNNRYKRCDQIAINAKNALWQAIREERIDKVWVQPHGKKHAEAFTHNYKRIGCAIDIAHESTLKDLTSC